MPGCEHDFYFFAGVFDDVVHVDIDLFDAEGVFVGLRYTFYSIAGILSAVWIVISEASRDGMGTWVISRIESDSGASIF